MNRAKEIGPSRANLVTNEEDERFVGHFDRSRVEAMES